MQANLTIALAMAAMVYSCNELGDTTWQTRSSCSQPQIQYPLVKMNTTVADVKLVLRLAATDA